MSIPLLLLPQEDDDGPLGAPEYDTISENGLLSRNEPIRSKVSKLTEKLRKRYPTTSTGQSALTHLLVCFLLLYLSDERRIFLRFVSYLSSEQMHFILYFIIVFYPNTIYLSVSLSKGNCSSCNAVFSVLKKRVRLKTCDKNWGYI